VTGERGPEIIVPRSPGTVIPNHALGSTSNQTIAQTNTFNVTVNGSAGTPEQNQDLADRMGRQLRDVAAQMVTQQIRTQMRPGGLLYGR
jgi:2-succinyl-5-enolpyruvyl-6-hydroxy-3-cyclohexene-1-carboxylate synthase